MKTEKHWAVGVQVQVRGDAVPVGAEDDDDSASDDVHHYGQGRTGAITGVSVDGGQDTYEVFGWWWKPSDLTVAN